MALTAPPPVAPPEAPDPEALIEEARRHRRRRRRRDATLAVLGAVAVFGAVIGFGGGDGADHAATAGNRPAAQNAPPVDLSTPARNGALTVMAVKAHHAEGPAGYYAISEVGRGAMVHAFVRCPYGLRWCGELQSIDWSPDGRHLALSVTTLSAENRANGLHVIDTVTGADHQLTECNRDTCTPDGLDWSPDGTLIAYAADNQIRVIRATGGAPVVLAGVNPPGTDHSPTWSPDGRWIAFADSSDSSLYRMRSDGSDVSLLVRNGSSPAWSPDGSTIAYRTRCGIRFVTPAGVDATPPTSGRCHAIGVSGPPVWSPDGRMIAVGSFAGGTYLMNADGTHLVHLQTPRVGPLLHDPRVAWQPLR
jgi:dipeptidyl aminopeptidase/acylaminoacyl peptidase